MTKMPKPGTRDYTIVCLRGDVRERDKVIRQLLTKIEHLEVDLRAERVAAHEAARRHSWGMTH